MSQPSPQATANRQQIPRYPGEKPMPPRTPSNDEAALTMAKLALQALEKLRERRRSKTTSKGGDAQKQGPQQGNTEEDKKDTVDDGTVAGDPDRADARHEASQPKDEDTDSSIPWPDVPFAYGDIPDLRLPLKSMYDGSGEWPKRTNHGGEKYSWSNIGYPFDQSLVVPDFEEDTHIETEERSVMELASDIGNIRSKAPEDIADGPVQRLEEDGRTIETFEVHGRTVCRVKLSDVNAFGNGSPYSLSKVSKSLERKINKEFGAQPDLQVERWVMAQVLLSMAGQIGGRTDDYFKQARSLAQQQLYVSPALEEEVRKEMQAGELEKDPAFSKMLGFVKKGCTRKAHNSYHQAKRDQYAVDNGLLYKVGKTDIVLILDRSDNLVLFQCSDVFNKLLTKAVQKLVVQSFDTYSTCTPVPFPDMTRHGLHWISFLVERPEFDFRNPDNDPRQAKSVGDPNGQKLPAPTKDLSGYRVPEGGNALHQLKKLRYSAFGACTEISRFFFQVLDPDLLQKYIRVADEVAKLDYIQFQTRRSNEPFLMRALLVNLMTYEHKDTGDWHHGYAFLLPVGDFTGGDLVLRELGLQIEAPSGCLQMFRGRELRHSITKWTGRRFVCVNVTHEAVHRWARRSMGEEVTGTPTSRAASIMADCIGVEPEDVVPEDQREEEMYHWLPEDEDEDELGDNDGSEASLPSNSDRKRPATSKHRAASSSDASAEASDKNAAKAKRQKTA
ncbi:hypothetical protein SLS63_006579 [Diaporthe eres]|uniref:Uncharacterized protein n=1 Tax=Diaporthe eres TaxID=83184 RepID=A0ABR1P804_DIAER